MFALRKIFLLLTILSLFPGCMVASKTGQHVVLNYNEPVTSVGKASGEILISKDASLLSNTKMPTGEWILGSYKQLSKIEITTKSDPGDWVMDSTKKELERAGYTVRNVDKLPENVQRGLVVSIKNVSVKWKMGFSTFTAIGDIEFNVELWKNGVKIKTVSTVGKDNAEADVGSTRTVEMSLLHAMQAAMIDIIPQIVTELR